MFAIVFLIGLVVLCVLAGFYGVDSRHDDVGRHHRTSSRVRRPPQALDAACGACSPRGAARATPAVGFGRSALAPRRRRLRDLLDDPLGRELAVPELRALVLGDRADDRARAARARAAARPRVSPAERLDVEERLDPRRALLRVLPAGTARPGEAEARLPTE